MKQFQEQEKFLNHQKKDTGRFKYAYRSPVIKKEEYVLNPTGAVPKGKVVVRSLGNYNLYKKKKKSIVFYFILFNSLIKLMKSSPNGVHSSSLKLINNLRDLSKVMKLSLFTDKPVAFDTGVSYNEGRSSVL